MRKMVRVLLVIGLLGSSLAGRAQNLAGRFGISREQAAEELRQALKDTAVTRKTAGKGGAVPDSITAVAVAEPFLFRRYGKKHILTERPYVIYLIDHYWVIAGTLPQEWAGGTFLIVLDNQNSRVMRVIHGQ